MDRIELNVTINGTGINPWHRFGLRQNPFPQLGKAEYSLSTAPTPCPRRPGAGHPRVNPRSIPLEEAEPAMTALESPDYQVARDRIKGNPVVSKMAAGIATVPLAELAHEDGTPRFAFMQHASRAFDKAESQNAGNPCYEPYPADARRHLGLIAEAVLAERAAIREAVASAMAAPGTGPESGDVTRIIERMRAGESPVAIARETGALQ